MSQFDKDDIDDVGLIKLDVLGVRMQFTIAHTLREIIRIDGPAAAIEGGLPVDARYIHPDGFIELGQIPHDDEATFEAIRSTHTLGMFQIESPGQRELIGKMQPDRYADLIADISLFRPGPMKGNMVAPYLDVKHGWAMPDYLHPSFRPFLQDAYGAVIYHEHVLRILHTTMGIDLATADELRRSMEKGVDLIEHEFRTRTTANLDEHGRRRFTDPQIEKIWTVLKGFGSYGFCKAHGAAFAQTTYESAWLKTHFPVEFFAGLFEHDPGMYPRRLLIAEARRMGIPLHPLDVNSSTDEYRVERDGFGVKGIRMSLTDVHGISQAEIARIVEHQPYASIDDFYTRATTSRPLMRRLAEAGALDEIARLTSPDAHRGSVIAHVRTLTARRSKPRADDHDGHLELFVGDDIPDAPQLAANERVRHELDVLGTEMTAHAIESYRPFLDEIGVTRAADLLTLRNGTEVLVAGIRVATQTPPMRSGKRVVFISLDDGSGIADCTFFEDAQQQAGPVLFGTKVLLVRGITRRTGARGVSIQAEAAWNSKSAFIEWSTVRSSGDRRARG